MGRSFEKDPTTGLFRCEPGSTGSVLLRPTLRKTGFSLLRLHPTLSQSTLVPEWRLPMASNCNAKRTQPLTTNTSTASVADVVCVIVPLASANVSRPSLVKGVAEPLAPTTAVDTDNAALTPTLSTTLDKLPKYHMAHKFLLTRRLEAHRLGVFTGRGSSTSSAIVMLVTKAMIARSVVVPKVTTLRPNVIPIVVRTSRS